MLLWFSFYIIIASSMLWHFLMVAQNTLTDVITLFITQYMMSVQIASLGLTIVSLRECVGVRGSWWELVGS